LRQINAFREISGQTLFFSGLALVSAFTETVLVVDDDAAVRSALQFALELEGFKVQLYDGSRAVLADANLPKRACLVVDYRMPGSDGLELVTRLRDRGVSLPVILISGRVTHELRHLAARIGVRQVLEKPLSDASLVENIRQALASPT
jgi:two-component system response regulator FixJ